MPNNIAKVVYMANSNATPEVWMDATPATAAAADITAPKTALLANGILTEGTGTGGGGGGSPWTLLKSQEFTVNTTSTSTTSVGNISGIPIWTTSKMIYIRVRDKAGKRKGFFYGSDTFFINQSLANNLAGTYSNASRIIYSVGTDGTWTVYHASATTVYGVAPASMLSSTVPNGLVSMSVRYNAAYSQTIDGTYMVEVYSLSWPDNVSPFDAEYAESEN